VALLQPIQPIHTAVISKSTNRAPSQLEEDVLAPDLSLRFGHHILYLMQVRAAELHRQRTSGARPVIYGKRALGWETARKH